MRCMRRADARLRIPMRPGLRSLNVAVAAAMVLGEALRQTGDSARDHPPLDGEGGSARFACEPGWGEAARATPAAYPHP